MADSGFSAPNVAISKQHGFQHVKIGESWVRCDFPQCSFSKYRKANSLQMS